MDIWKILTLRCAESTEIASRELDEPLERTSRIALAVHLFLCRHCRRFRRQLAIIRRIMHRIREQSSVASAPRQQLSDATRNRISLAMAQMLRNQPPRRFGP